MNDINKSIIKYSIIVIVCFSVGYISASSYSNKSIRDLESRINESRKLFDSNKAQLDEQLRINEQLKQSNIKLINQVRGIKDTNNKLREQLQGIGVNLSTDIEGLRGVIGSIDSYIQKARNQE